MELGFIGIIAALGGLLIGLNVKGLADKYFNYLARTHYTLPNARPWNIRLVGWGGAFIGAVFIVGGFSGVMTAS
ncbi:hypothetical protein [Streptomyces sp. PU-14G]|uniref:hypothetical protein n=1 Tax=Streptomyces sp. PU-14G TaxID=2800808 RepID=UPI0034DEFF96